MQRPQPETVTLKDILITEELFKRSPQLPHWQAETEAMRSLAHQMARDSQSLMQSLADTALELCRAGTAGVSLLETTPEGEELFRWAVLAGTLAHHVGGSTPRNFSPCGVCLDQGTPVLFSHPESYFTYFQAANTPIVEGLVLPLLADHHVLGTIWIMSHDQQRQFDPEDVRIMTSLADFTATALLLNQRQTKELLAVNATLEANVEKHRQTEAKLREAQRRLELSLTGADLGIWTYRIGTDEFWADDRAQQMHGYELDEVHTFAQAGENIHPEDRDRAQATLAQVIQDRSKLQMEYRVIWRDGSVHWIVSYAEFVLTGEQDQGMFYGVAQDITKAKRDEVEREQVEANLRQSEAKYRSLFESIDEGYALCQLIYDGTGKAIDLRLLEVNPAFERLTGLADVVGKTATEINPNLAAVWIEIFGNVVQTGKPAHFEHYIERVDYWFDVHASRFDGDTHQIVIIFNNITERKQAEETLAADLQDTKLLHNLSAQLVPQDDIQTLYQEIVATAIALTRADAGSIQILDEATQELVMLANQGAGSEITEHFYRVDASSNTSCGRALVTGERTFVDFDVPESEDPDGSMRMHVEEGYLSAQSTPLITRSGKAIGMFSTHWCKHYRPTERELRFLDLLARQAADLIEQRQAQVALRESEEKYRSLFNSMDEAYAVVEVLADDNGEWNDFLFLEVNPAFVKQTGMEYPVGRKATELLGTPNSNWAKIYGHVAETGEPLRFEEGEAILGRVFDLYVFRLGGDDSRRVAVLFTDTTERKQAEAQLRRVAELDAFRVKLSDALRSLSDPVEIQAEACRLLGEHLGVDRAYYAEVNEAENYTRINQNYLRGDSPSLVCTLPLTDYGWVLPYLKRGETVVMPDIESSDVVPVGDRAAMAAIKVAAHISLPLIKGGALVGALNVTESEPREWTDIEIELVRETAERIWAAIERTYAERDLRESEIQRIQEQSAREEERQRAEALAELDRAKTLFFTNISHEFRTPLTLSLAPLQDALSDRNHPLDPVQRERLELVHHNSLRLLKLVNTLLNFSRIEAGRIAAAYEPTDLALFTTELASVFRSAIERAGLQLIVDCPPLREPVYVDREMWEKIVLNLLSNAFKFTFEGAITVRLHSTDGNQALLQIQDTGTGIAPEHLPHLFERFYQVRGAQARTHEGSGIGLALVHELVRLQGGTIEVSSTVGEGTCFAIAIPFGTDHLPQERIHTARTQTSTAIDTTLYVEEAERWILPQTSEVLETSEVFAAARVLLIDDNADMRAYLTRILSEHVQVEAVADGATALAVAQERVPDLILSDVMMPGLEGFELLEALRSDPRTREVPIILLSARAGEEAIAEGLAAGADDYLIKPFSAQELVSRVTAHLQMAQLRAEALQQERTMNRQKDEFISLVSHELNTPLVSILGWTHMLRSSPPNAVMLNKALDTIERNATLQGKLVQDLLDLSRITAGKFRLNLQPIELQPVIETAIATVSQTAADKGIHLTWQDNVTEPVVVMGDSDRLQQVICNLLTNAIKFTPESGSVTLELSVINNDRSADASYAEIRVIDSGIGIAADFLPYVFDRFRQAEGAHSAKGLGLGLAIAHHIVELHDGTIYAESAGPGQGATFIVKLPLFKDDKVA
jgi:PAS domain S-box-containing protein